MMRMVAVFLIAVNIVYGLLKEANVLDKLGDCDIIDEG